MHPFRTALVRSLCSSEESVGVASKAITQFQAKGRKILSDERTLSEVESGVNCTAQIDSSAALVRGVIPELLTPERVRHKTASQLGGLENSVNVNQPRLSLYFWLRPYQQDLMP